jgi:predicted transcriptional regulator
VENPAEPFDRGLELIRDAEEYLGLNSAAIPSYVDALLDGHAQGRLEFEGVIEARFLDTLRDKPERTAQWLKLADAELTWVYDGRIPINLHIVDELLLIWLGERREVGLDIKGLLECEHPAVLSWAESLYADYRSAAEPLDASMLP